MPGSDRRRGKRSDAEGSILLELRRLHRSRTRVVASLLVLLAAGAAMLTWAIVHRPPVRPLSSIESAEPITMWVTGYRIVPDRSPEPPPPSPLERRLSSFARAVETAREGLDPPLVAFGAEALTEEIERAITQIDSRAEVSVHVRDLDSSRILFDYQGDLLLNPASNNKLLTGAAALDLLGPDYVFETRVLVVGDALYLVGEGDPTIDGEGLRALAREVAERVSVGELSKIVIDEGAFSTRHFGPGFAPEWTDEGYMAPSGALSLAFNTVEITVYATGPRETAVAIEPPSTNLRVDNRARVGAGRVAIRARADETSGPDSPRTTIVIEGNVAGRRGTTVRRRILDPGGFTGGALALALADATQSEPLPVERGRAPAPLEVAPASDEADEAGELPRMLGRSTEGLDVELVALRRSAPLFEIVTSMLAWSNNHIAEQLVRTLDWRLRGSPGDWQGGCEVVRAYWQTIGEDADALVYVNGSGLTQEGRVSTRGLVDMLAVVHRTAPPGSSLVDALPIAGSQGTLRGRLRRSGKRVRAKTGTMTGVSGLTGVITSDAGEPMVAFSIIINVRESSRVMAESRRAIEDRIVMAVLGHIDGWEAVRGELILDLEPLDVRAVESAGQAP